MTPSVDPGPDERAVRDLVTAWIGGVGDADLDAVAAHHAVDVVLFDVPPPEAGVRGISDYRAAWRPFLQYVSSGARFELAELHVEAGADVAWAWALLRCGTDEDLTARPDRRLRLSVGLRRRDGEWEMAHEHHSFTGT